MFTWKNIKFITFTLLPIILYIVFYFTKNNDYGTTATILVFTNLLLNDLKNFIKNEDSISFQEFVELKDPKNKDQIINNDKKVKEFFNKNL